MKIQERFKQLVAQRHNKIRGFNNAIAFHSAPRTSYEFGGGFVEGKMYAITADTSGGKTKYAKWLMLLAYFGIKKLNNPDFYVIWYALEESEEEFIDSILITIFSYLYPNDPVPSYADINSYNKDLIDEQTFEKLQACIPLAHAFYSRIIVLDSDNPEQMYNDFLKTIIDRKDVVFENNRYKKLTKTQYIIITDHLSLLKGDKYDAIQDWVVTYCKKIITLKFKYIVLNILQQSFDSQRSHAFGKGDFINARRVEPSLDKLGNNKEISRDHYVVVGLFNPYAFDIKEYYNYDIIALEDYYRCAIILKNRYGLSNRRLHYYFYGSSFRFNELPWIKKDEKNQILENLYEKLLINRK